MSRASVPRSRRARARLALAACALWLAGFEVLPWLHVALHDELAPHVHVGDTIVSVSFAGPTHRHADGTVHRDPAESGGGAGAAAPAPRKAPPDGQAHLLAAALAHGEHSLAHHGIAAIPTAPPLHQPLPIDRRPLRIAARAGDHLISSAVPTAAARGPPSRASC